MGLRTFAASWLQSNLCLVNFWLALVGVHKDLNDQ